MSRKVSIYLGESNGRRIEQIFQKTVDLGKGEKVVITQQDQKGKNKTLVKVDGGR